MLETVDCRKPAGKRDYAILLLLVTYGLRAREVAALTLDDIDWRNERLTFALNNKDKYPQIRDVLFDLASNTKNPTDTQISEALKGLQVDYKKVDNSTLSAGTTYFHDLVKKYSVDRAPTIVIVNSKTGQATTFAGLDKINTAKVLEAVDSKR